MRRCGPIAAFTRSPPRLGVEHDLARAPRISRLDQGGRQTQRADRWRHPSPPSAASRTASSPARTAAIEVPAVRGKDAGESHRDGEEEVGRQVPGLGRGGQQLSSASSRRPMCMSAHAWMVIVTQQHARPVRSRVRHRSPAGRCSTARSWRSSTASDHPTQIADVQARRRAWHRRARPGRRQPACMTVPEAGSPRKYRASATWPVASHFEGALTEHASLPGAPARPRRSMLLRAVVEALAGRQLERQQDGGQRAAVLLGAMGERQAGAARHDGARACARRWRRPRRSARGRDARSAAGSRTSHSALRACGPAGRIRTCAFANAISSPMRWLFGGGRRQAGAAARLHTSARRARGRGARSTRPPRRAPRSRHRRPSRPIARRAGPALERSRGWTASVAAMRRGHGPARCWRRAS